MRSLMHAVLTRYGGLVRLTLPVNAAHPSHTRGVFAFVFQVQQTHIHTTEHYKHAEYMHIKIITTRGQSDSILFSLYRSIIVMKMR